MDNIKYYILAYIKLIYLFLEKYLTLLYLLVKVQFITENKNIDIYYDAIDNLHYSLERRCFMPNSEVCEFYALNNRKTLMKIVICTTKEYILIQLKRLCDPSLKNDDYNNSLKRIIFAKRNVRKEKEGPNINFMVTQNINYYFKKKNSIVYTKQYNSNSRKSSRLLYKVK